jgi:hypothetical protein
MVEMKMKTHHQEWTRRGFLKAATGAAAFLPTGKARGKALLGPGSVGTSHPNPKIWPDKQKQTIGFELPELPDEIFKIVIPEIISDTQQPIVPWSQPSPQWEIGEDSARYSAEVASVFRMNAEVLFRGERIEARVRVTNLSSRTWEKANAFTCFAYYTAPGFDDPQLTRTFLPVDGQWKSVAELFQLHHPGERPYTFFPVSDGPALDDFWLFQQIPQRHPQAVSKGCACVVSANGNWVAGMTAPNPAFVFTNRRERCVHADPLLGDIAPGETAEGVSHIYILRGPLEGFAERCGM